MSEPARLADLIARVTTGDPWHGPNLATLLADLTAEQAHRRAAPGTHSIWELVLHLTGWAREVEARLAGGAAGEPPAGDWPAVTDAGEAAWAAARDGVFAAHASLATALCALDDASLDRPVIDYRDRAAGTGQSTYVTLHGLLHHTVYHSGQIGMLRRSLG
jgi:uncharacterized damage-inducible protein DinB